MNAFVEAWRGPIHARERCRVVALSGLHPTSARWELRFAANCLGHFDLPLDLLNALAAAAGYLEDCCEAGVRPHGLKEGDAE